MKDRTPALGFTGSREEPSHKQATWLQEATDAFCHEFGVFAEAHHGACVGGDELMHYSALKSGLQVVVHPPADQKLMMDLSEWEEDARVRILPPKPYHDRNRDIVHDSTRMCSTPNSLRRPHSGTWYTIDYAIRRGRSIEAIYPDGSSEFHRGGMCAHCGVRVQLVDLLVGEPEWRHISRHRTEYVTCHKWPYAPAEPELWTIDPKVIGVRA